MDKLKELFKIHLNSLPQLKHKTEPWKYCCPLTFTFPHHSQFWEEPAISFLPFCIITEKLPNEKMRFKKRKHLIPVTTSLLGFCYKSIHLVYERYLHILFLLICTKRVQVSFPKHPKWAEFPPSWKQEISTSRGELMDSYCNNTEVEW